MGTLTTDVRAVIERIVEEKGGGVQFQLFVKPDSPADELRLEGDELVFYTREPAERGRANAALIRYLSKLFKISPSNIAIVYGLRSRVKRINITVSKDVAVEKLLSVIKK